MKPNRVVGDFLARSGLGAAPSLIEIVDSLRAVPYGRPSVRDAATLITEWRGTCTTKHALLAQAIQSLFPDLEPQVVHRVYQVTRENAPSRAVHAVPPGGLNDVHRYLTVLIGGTRIPLDVTFPGAPWDGHSPMALACGDGVDYPAAGDIDRQKKSLEDRYCDPTIREPFIAALS